MSDFAEEPILAYGLLKNELGVLVAPQEGEVIRVTQRPMSLEHLAGDKYRFCAELTEKGPGGAIFEIIGNQRKITRATGFCLGRKEGDFVIERDDENSLSQSI